MIERKAFTLQLTEKCNLSCTYCYVRNRTKNDPNDCSLELCQTFIDFALRESGRKLKISFFGGEPLLRPDLIRHTVHYGKQAAHKIGKIIRFHIVTNGTLLEDAIGDFIVQEGISIEVSIDGPQEIHDCNRPYINGWGSFRPVYNNLIRFRKRHPKHEIHIFSVTSGIESLPWLRSLLKELKISVFTFNPVYLTPEQEKIWGKSYLDITEDVLRTRIETHRKHFLQENADFDEGINHQISLFLNKKIRRSCTVGIDTTITTQSGEIYPCPFFVGHKDQIIGDVVNGFYHEKVKPYLDRTINSLENCAQCTIKYFCGGGCAFCSYQRTGAINFQFEDYCSAQKRYAEELLKSIIIIAAMKPETLLFKVIAPSVRSKLNKSSMKTSSLQFSPKPLDVTPKNFIVQLTKQCNLSCDYCFEVEKTAINEDLDIKTARSIVDYIISSSCKKPLVCLFGGEPLLNWEVGRFLIESLAKESEKHGKKPFFHIVTNGTLFTEEIARILARYNVTVQISIDGSQAIHDLHRKHRDGSGSYDSILRGLVILRKANPRAKIDAQVTLTPENTDVINIARELKNKGFRRINFLKSTRINHSSAKWSQDDIKKLIKAREEFFPFFLDSVITGIPDIDIGLAALVASQPQGPKELCGCGNAEVYIDTKGDIYPCPLIYSPGKYVLGNCNSLNSEKSLHLPRTTKKIDDDCLKCWAYCLCGGGCKVHCQKCPLIPSTLPLESQKLWCELMRAEFARSIIAHKILKRFYPERLKVLKSIFK
jgi:uncharacterized protein